MAFGQPPFVRDYIDALIERRLGMQKGPAADTVLRAGPTSGTVNAYDPGPTPQRPSMLRSAAGEGLQYGTEILGAGIEAGLGQRNFGGGLVAGLGAGLQAYGRGKAGRAKAEQEAGYKERELRSDEKRASASMLQAVAANTRDNEPKRTKRDELLSTRDFLAEDLQLSPDAVVKYFTEGKSSGRSGGGTDRFRLATALFQTGKAASMADAEIAAATMLRSAQPVGSVSKVVVDPETFASTTIRMVVSRGLNPYTGQYELMDEAGNILTNEDMQSFQQGSFVTGQGGPARQPVEPPINSDFTTTVPGTSEDQVLNLLQEAEDPQVLRAYASGVGPLGNSTTIKELAAGLLRELGRVIAPVPSHGVSRGPGG
jgi:hypothetical protein